ncbi:serine/threonine-protein phosphatase 6 regulatory ankyrin repeat subunit A-like [Macrobrachium nipponense]|uniref:serine/threonine-protein phosphatase 6 regulatory ankyrin repeat subunit A-like n=1 Tax=Macrobrachium nipponense TaxID=159736 RepID=UPI0030C7A62D
MTPLIIASKNLRYGDRGVVKALLDAGAKVNHQDSEGHTALSRSLEKNPIVIYDAVNSLLAAAADVELPPEPAMSPLQEVASKSDNHRLLEQLIEAGADVNRTSAAGKTALMYSATGSESGADLLIDAGVDINAKDDAGDFALLLACKSGRSESQSLFVDHLLEKGVDVNAASATGNTALHEAARNALPYVCRRLVESGASVYAVDYQGYTPLMSMGGYFDHRHLVIEILLAAGSDINHESNTDGTVVHLLVTYGDAMSLKLVMGFCPDLTKTNDQAQTPLALAQSRFNSEEFIDILNAKYTASCAYDLKIYKEGDRWCDHKTSKAYECLSNCQSQEIVGGLPECGSGGGIPA